ncbi:MAG: ABC transporter ATP-binding protein [Ignisphaera sp.]|nr:ATP-binding cassette domain-containing protein [Ignisphaera sp.]MDW8085597.1 ABC transporter ATP-binding protein [Ignisphaera sp.]
MLKAENLVKIYETGFVRKRRITAVDNVSFDVKEGEVASLVGESGSGKTTTAKIVLRLLPPTSGSVSFKGRDVWKELKTREQLVDYWRKVHAVFQDPYASYNPFYTIDRVLKQALRLVGVDRNSEMERKLIEEALNYVGLSPEDVLGKYPHQLSGGQRQRIMIARCWLLKPNLIIADEPVSMIDASMRGAIIKLFMNLRDDYRTSIVFITHDLGLAYYVSDKIMVMFKGRIVDIGAPDEVVKHPQHEYTRKLLESVPTLYRKWRWV